MKKHRIKIDTFVLIVKSKWWIRSFRFFSLPAIIYSNGAFDKSAHMAITVFVWFHLFCQLDTHWQMNGEKKKNGYTLKYWLSTIIIIHWYEVIFLFVAWHELHWIDLLAFAHNESVCYAMYRRRRRRRRCSRSGSHLKTRFKIKPVTKAA